MSVSTKKITTDYVEKLRQRVKRLIMAKAMLSPEDKKERDMLDNITETYKVVIRELNEILNPIKS